MNVKELVAQMTLEEKAGITSGKDNWFTKAIKRLGIPSVRMSDGPHGLRTQSGEVNSLVEGSSAKAICYPAACATAASFDREMLYRMGQALGTECQALGVNVLLGPGVNMKRTPLCGRNFEYFSEDPCLAGQLGASFVQGVQSMGVGTSLKHFFANNQETRRMDISAEMDERTMREIYLPAFETVVKEAQPWTIMASYNKVGGVYSTANKAALTDILRKEWGFAGVVTSDWGATHDRAAAIEAGCDLTMPAEDTDAQLVEAVQNGSLDEKVLDTCVERLLTLAFRAAESKKENTAFPYAEHHAIAQKAAEDSIVLLKNNGSLPLSPEKKVAFLGAFAAKPRYQGGGSSHVNPYCVKGALDAVREMGLDVQYAPGYDALGEVHNDLLAQAVEAAAQSDVAVVFIGLPDAMESEGSDRGSLDLPAGHNALVDAVCAVCKKVVVVLHNGSPVVMPWLEKVDAVLESYLGGEAVGEAVAKVLLGQVNPSGHLPETFPLRLEDTPGYLYGLGECGKVAYKEGLFIGYRYYESKKMPVLFPFGYGLSYTEFAYSNLTVSPKELEEGDTVTVTVDVTNVGSRPGKAVVQLYVAPDKVEMVRPLRELKDFAKIPLETGETKTVTFTLNKRSIAHWSTITHTWRAENGGYAVQIGANAHDIVLEDKLFIHADPIPPVGGYTLSTPMNEFAKTHKGRAFINRALPDFLRGMVAAGFIPKEAGTVLETIPGGITLEMLDKFAATAGAAAGVGGGTDALLGQPISMLTHFITAEKKTELTALLTELNGSAV